MTLVDRTIESWMTPTEVARARGLFVKTLANWRVLGNGPEFMKVGRLVRYREADVVAWQRQH